MKRTITLCGSTRFKAEFQALERALALKGWSVYSCSLWGQSGDELKPDEKLMLDAVHMVKIMNSEFVFVINPGGYVGDSTRREVYLAAALGKSITFMHTDNAFAQEWTRLPAVRL